jgi:hypothetical protein
VRLVREFDPTLERRRKLGRSSAQLLPAMLNRHSLACHCVRALHVRPDMKEWSVLMQNQQASVQQRFNQKNRK